MAQVRCVRVRTCTRTHASQVGSGERLCEEAGEVMSDGTPERGSAGSWARGCASLLAGLNIPHSSRAHIPPPLAQPGIILLAQPPVLILLFPFQILVRHLLHRGLSSEYVGPGR